MSLNDTTASNRLHIAIFGKRNSGKSSLINAITNQNIALVSEFAGTTTDPVFKAMELHPIGPVMFVDTAGFDDEGELGGMRVEKTRNIIDKTDIAVMLFSEGDLSYEKEWLAALRKKNVPIVAAVSKSDLSDTAPLLRKIQSEANVEPIAFSSVTGDGLAEIREAIVRCVPEDYGALSLTGDYVNEGDTVLLIMPQDIQAPKGRLILPQVQTIRDLLDNKCIVISSTADNMKDALIALKQPPALIITDSQCFGYVYENKPPESRLTSFSVLMAAYKSDIGAYINGAAAIDKLTENSRVLIAEACTHAPLAEDIGRVKIPRALRKKVGEGLKVDIVSGVDFPKDLSEYDLIIHCGGCMFSRKYLLSRVEAAKAQGVPITNYGVVLAKLNGILDKIDIKLT